jgi:hypothetical protein
VSDQPTVGNRAQQRINPRAASARQPEHEPQQVQARTRTRRRFADAAPHSHDQYVNHDAIPDTVDLNWKRFSAYGQEYPYYLEQQRKQGWEPVNPQEHPDWVSLPPGYDATVVLIEGLILMERPMELTIEARQENDVLNKRRIDEAKMRAGQKSSAGEAERLRPKIEEQYGRMIDSRGQE